LHPAVIEIMNKVCTQCSKALKFKDELPAGLCCCKVKLPVLNAPPEPLFTLVSGTVAQSEFF